MKKTVLNVLLAAALFAIPFTVGCNESSCDKGCAKTTIQQELAAKDAQIAQLQKENDTLKAKQELSRKQLEQSANMMMDAFKQSQAENKTLKSEITKLKAKS